MNKILFSSKKMDYETPQALYDELNDEFHFTCDVAADDTNYKHDKYYTVQDDALIQNWEGVCWCNPPYGRNIGEWVKKAYNEAKNGVTTVMLIPARTDTKYFHEYIYKQHEIRFIKGRLKFGNSKNSAPFPSMIVVFKENEQ